MIEMKPWVQLTGLDCFLARTMSAAAPAGLQIAGDWQWRVTAEALGVTLATTPPQLLAGNT